MTTETDKTTEQDQPDNSGLVAKNKELLAKLKKQQAQIDELLSAKDEAETEAATKAGDIEKIKAQLEAKHKKEIDALNTQISTLSADLRTIRVDAEISSAIAKSNVNKEHVEAVEALLHRKVQYEDGVASIDGKPIADYTQAYFAKAGAVYVNAPNNSGAGTTGNDGTKPTTYKIPTNASEVTPELFALASTNPTEYNAIMDAAGLSNLKV